MKNCLWYDAIHDFSVWLRTNPAYINWFPRHTKKNLSGFSYFAAVLLDMLIRTLKWDTQKLKTTAQNFTLICNLKVLKDVLILIRVHGGIRYTLDSSYTGI